MQHATRRMAGWGNYPTATCETYMLQTGADAAQLIARAPNVLFRGAGKSYGDAALNPAALGLTERMNCFLEIDGMRGTVRAEAGVTLREILEIMVPRGWFLPVIPGTQHVTLGGALAGNVHGKNHYRLGEFAQHVLSVTLRLADNSLVLCSRDENADLFWATAGGLGMTGYIEELTLQLIPVRSAQMRVHYSAADSIAAMVALFEAQKDSAEYLVGWIDHFARGAQLGRGIVEAANHVPTDNGSLNFYRQPAQQLAVPCYLPALTLNRYNMALYNKLRFKRALAQPVRTIGFDHFFHPLDGIGHWNRLYGRRGLLQYQCIVPDGAGLRVILEKLQRAKQFSFLAVLKYHGAQRGMMSFSMPGYSLALDFPNTRAVHALLNDIDAEVIAQGGRVYLAKDARLSRGAFEAMYAHALPAWRNLLKEVDPERRFMSSMARRLGFKEWA